MDRGSIDGQSPLPWYTSIVKFKYYEKESLHYAPSINLGPVDSLSECTLPIQSLTTKCKGPPQEALFGAWGFMAGSFDYELTLIRVRNSSINFHRFPTPKI